jgi:hypothetical protein
MESIARKERNRNGVDKLHPNAYLKRQQRRDNIIAKTIGSVRLLAEGRYRLLEMRFGEKKVQEWRKKNWLPGSTDQEWAENYARATDAWYARENINGG